MSERARWFFVFLRFTSSRTTSARKSAPFLVSPPALSRVDARAQLAYMPTSLPLFGQAGPDPDSAAALAALGLPASPPTTTPLPDILTIARVACLRPGVDDEWWRGNVDRLRCASTSARLETAALARTAVAARDAGATDLAAKVDALISAAAPPAEAMAETGDGALVDWAHAAGATSRLCEAATPAGLRGAAAAVDIHPGDVVVRVPAPLVITPATAAATELGGALAALPLSADERFILFCVVDSADPDSPHAPVWASLRDVGDTGLTIGNDDAALLDGTVAGGVLATARAHVAAAATAAAPALAAVATAFAKSVPGLAYVATPAGYARAVSLIHSHAVDLVCGPPGTPPTPALIPPLYLANHHSFPHAVAYGRAGDDGSVAVRAFRGCRRGDQFFLGYGRLDATPSLVFYGFVPVDADTGVEVPLDGGATTVTLRRTEAASRAAVAAAPSRRALAAALAAETKALERALDRAKSRSSAWADVVTQYCEAVLGVAREAARWVGEEG